MPKQPLSFFLSEFDKQKNQLVKEFLEFLRFPSVSSEPIHREDVNRCATWVANFLREAGMDVESYTKNGHPVIFANWLKAGPDKPTVLIYNHYDVQPVDPLELWKSPPFEPTIVGEEVYARGAEDNKGQCFYVISAVRNLLKTQGKLAVNLKLCIEGEEETGSAALSTLVKEQPQLFKADHLFIVDLGLHERNSPALTLGTRGIVTMTLELTGSSTDLHSGMVGGMVYNPNRALAEMLSALHLPDGRVAVPGFYDDVIEIPKNELEMLSFDFDEKQFEQHFGTEPQANEPNFTAVQCAWIRPTLEINGMGGGYTGDGFKTVIPAKSLAKISCRLVPKQDPTKIGALVAKFLKEKTPKGIVSKIDINPGVGAALRASPDAKAAQVTAAVMAELLNKPTQFILSGGSIPIVPDLAQAAETEDVVLMGFGLPDDGIHAPNEHFGLDRIRMGFATISSILERL